MLNLSERALAAREQRVPRDRIAATLRQNGIPPHQASEITDLGLQAAFKAMDVLIETPDLSPDPLVKVNALNVARGVLAAELALLDCVVAGVNAQDGIKGVNVVLEGAV
ncbi:MAG: hypothetical protein MK010_03880 [Erythrobacter sp.]|nr:hypothetical protein [Erythrobacter sp.]